MCMTISDKKELNRGVIRVPTALLGVFIFMSAQTLGGVWWASSITTTLKYVVTQQEQMLERIEHNTKDRYTSKQAFNDKSEIYAEIKANVIKHDLLQRQVNTFQAKYESLLESLVKKNRGNLE